MKRKIIQLAKNTLVVSIPSEIVKKFKLNKGNEVEVIENGGEIIIKFDKKTVNKRIEINIDGMTNKLIKDLLYFSNTLGYDEITLKYDENKDMSFINELTHEFEGLAILKQTENNSTFKHISQEDSNRFEEILNRAMQVTLSLSEEILDSLKKKKFNRLKNLFALEYTNNKLTNHCSRILIKGNYRDNSKTPFLFTLVWNLEIIADFYRRICYDVLNLNNQKKPLYSKTIKSLEMINELLIKYYELYKKLDTKGIIESANLKNEIGVLVEEIFNEKKGLDAIVAHYVMDIATFVIDSISLLLAINKLEN